MDSKTVLVTGAATGIGLAVVEKLSQEGWHVLATARPAQEHEELLKIIPETQIIKVDLSIPQSIDVLLNVVTKFGRLDAFVSNAGLAFPGPIEALPQEDLYLQFAVNTFAPMKLAQGLLPLLRKTNGRMIFVGAGQGRVALPFGGPYGASKAALAALTDSLRAEISDSGITVSLIEPGAVKTMILESSRKRAMELLQKISPEAKSRYEKPLRKTLDRSEEVFKSAMHPEKLAELVSKILSVKRPKPRYLIGRDAFALAIIALLPARLRAKLVAKLSR